MESRTPPLYVISPGAVYRRDDVDATHSPMFHQLEGLAVDEGLSLAHLIGTLKHVAGQLLGSTEYRIIPDFFPFTEPSIQLLVRWTDRARPHVMDGAVGRGDGRPQRVHVRRLRQ